MKLVLTHGWTQENVQTVRLFGRILGKSLIYKNDLFKFYLTHTYEQYQVKATLTLDPVSCHIDMSHQADIAIDFSIKNVRLLDGGKEVFNVKHNFTHCNHCPIDDFKRGLEEGSQHCPILRTGITKTMPITDYISSQLDVYSKAMKSHYETKRTAISWMTKEFGKCTKPMLASYMDLLERYSHDEIVKLFKTFHR